jgi:UDP-N-acetyl-D-glucosamine/UDP-N-acetyl-D-galactosamine dehydrogenase
VKVRFIDVLIADYLEGKKRVGVMGLGYVGLPLLLAFEKHFSMVGFDVSRSKIDALINGVDETHEVGDEALSLSNSLFTSDPAKLSRCDTIIVAVPTPIDEFKTPDLEPVIWATQLIGEHLKPGVVIVYESTVYPGVTEEVCLPVLERCGHIHGRDFHLAYSPERINPGDKEHRLESITKIVSGDTPETLDFVAALYGKVISAGVFRTTSIRVAEAAKVIENIQRDVNIALMNELAIVFGKLGIDTGDVLKAAGTKWNFIPMFPGLVGGHCIGVDPYYLTYRAEQAGYHPQIITSGRRINDDMGRYIAEQTVKKMIQAGHRVKEAKVLILGVTFKENVPDIRNSKVIDIIRELKSYACNVYARDPHVSSECIRKNFEALVPEPDELFDAVILAVPHLEFSNLKNDLRSNFVPGVTGVFIDIRSKIATEDLPSDLLHWRL